MSLKSFKLALQRISWKCNKRAQNPGRPPSRLDTVTITLLVWVTLSLAQNHEQTQDPNQNTTTVEVAKLNQKTTVPIPYGTTTWGIGTNLTIVERQNDQVLVEANGQQKWIPENQLSEIEKKQIVGPAPTPVPRPAPPNQPTMCARKRAPITGKTTITGKENPTNKHHQMEQEVLVLTNKERVAQGLTPLTLDENLSRAARFHAKHMAENGYYKHDTYERDSYGPRLTMYFPHRITAFTNGAFKGFGENIYMGIPTAAEAVRGWMKSPGHKRNILKPTYTKLGVGVYQGFWVQDFGAD